MPIVLCVDDAGMAAPNEASIDKLVKELCDEGFNLEMEGPSKQSTEMMEVCA